MTDEEEVDVNEKFTNLLLAEENAEHIGYMEGYEIGKKQLTDGFHLGYHRTSLIAAQLGYYSGVLEQYLNINKCNSEKNIQIAEQLLRDIYNFPKFNDETVDISKAFDNIKFKYAKFCSLTKICSSYPEVDKLDF